MLMGSKQFSFFKDIIAGNKYDLYLDSIWILNTPHDITARWKKDLNNIVQFQHHKKCWILFTKKKKKKKKPVSYD